MPLFCHLSLSTERPHSVAWSFWPSDTLLYLPFQNLFLLSFHSLFLGHLGPFTGSLPGMPSSHPSISKYLTLPYPWRPSSCTTSSTKPAWYSFGSIILETNRKIVWLRRFLNRELWFLNGSGLMILGVPGDTELTSVAVPYSCAAQSLKVDRSQTGCLVSTTLSATLPITTSCVTYNKILNKQTKNLFASASPSVKWTLNRIHILGSVMGSVS